MLLDKSKLTSQGSVCRPQPFLTIPRGRAPRCAHGQRARQNDWSAYHRLLTVSLASSVQTSATGAGLYDVVAKITKIKELAGTVAPLAQAPIEPKRFVGSIGDRVGFIATKEIAQDGVIMTIPEDAAITSIDAEKQELIGSVAAGCSELIALTLWLLAERAKAESSQYARLIQTLPERTQTPLLWSDAEIEELLRGSPTQAEARSRAAELRAQWQALHDSTFSKDPQRFSPAVFGYDAFAAAFSVVLGHAVYLPSASCFALLPVASLMGRTGNDNGSNLDYDAERGAVVVRAGRPYREGQEVLLNDPRPNGELLLATGMVPETNMADFIEFPASLIPADRYFSMKTQILETLGFGPQERFPVFADRMPNQLLSYLRLSRVSDPALFAKVSFEQDVVLSQLNEYEILQLLMGDCRERLQAYATSYEEDIKANQRPDLPVRERLAVKVRLGEKKIINETMDAVRRRLAPIRGIPTKSGSMQDPNSDLMEIFDTLESIPTAPKKLLDGFLSWARGEQDPDWGKPANDKKPPRPW